MYIMNVYRTCFKQSVCPNKDLLHVAFKFRVFKLLLDSFAFSMIQTKLIHQSQVFLYIQHLYFRIVHYHSRKPS